jgi:hypothetical protein
MKSHYDYIYVICCYPGHTDSRFRGALKGQFLFLEKYHYLNEFVRAFEPYPSNEPCKEVLCIVSLRGKGRNDILHHRIREDAPKQVQEIWNGAVTKPNLSLLVDQRNNWGGTIGALWDTWKYLLGDKITSNFVILCEDDWVGNNWPLREKLVNDGYIYVGMQRGCVDRSDFMFIRDGYRYWNRKDHTMAIDNHPNFGDKFDRYIFTDGGYYFFKYESLRMIKEKMGAFTKADPNEEYNYTTHGCDYGEVGFPTELAIHGWKPIVLGPLCHAEAGISDSGELNNCDSFAYKFMRH